LSEKFALNDYSRFLAQNSAGIRFLSWIESDEFIAQAAAGLKMQHIDLDRNSIWSRLGSSALRKTVTIVIETDD